MTVPDHPIFAQSLPASELILSTGPAPVPYHVYEGHGLVILGYCDGTALLNAFAGQDVHPVLTQSGQGILLVFVCDFARASLGPHHELHITALAAPETGQVVADDPAAALASFATRPDWGVLSLHLWNDTSRVVAYNSEYLGLQAQQSDGHVTVQDGRLDFAFSGPDGGPLAAGNLRVNARSDAGLMMRVMRRLGWGALWDALRKRPALAHVINRKSQVIPRNGRAKTLTAPDKMIVTRFDPARDHVDFTAGPYAAFGFAPKIIEHLTPFRFVYLHPDAS